MRFFNRERTSSQSGFVLGAALLIAVLYFALMELLLIDSTRSLQEAERVRSRIVAATLAEDAAELAAAGMIAGSSGQVDSEDAQGKIIGKYQRNGCCNFELFGEATTKGVPPATAYVRLQGRIVANHVTIDYATHSQ